MNVTGLEDQEWRDFLFLCYLIDPSDLSNSCNGCGVQFYVAHDLDCKKGVLVTTPHNDLHDGFTDLVSNAFTPWYICDDHLIHTGCAMWGVKNQPVLYHPQNNLPQFQEESKKKVDLLIRYLW